MILSEVEGEFTSRSIRPKCGSRRFRNRKERRERNEGGLVLLDRYGDQILKYSGAASTSGSAPRLQRGGEEFESPAVHNNCPVGGD